MPRFSKALKSLEQPWAKNSRGPKRPDDSTERAAHHFDRDPAGYADAYLDRSTSSAFFFARRQAIVMHFLRRLEGGLILDIGCGPGIYAKPCIDQGFRYYGLDISPQMINEARGRFGNLTNVEFAVGDARQLPFAPNSVDGVLCLGMLEYVAREQETAYFNEMARILKPGGIIIFSFLNASSPYWVWAGYFFPPVKFLLRNIKAIFKNSKYVPFKVCRAEELPTRKFRLRERTKLIQATGLSLAGKIYFSLNIFPSPLDGRFPRQMVLVSSKLEHLLQLPLLKWLGMGFVVVVQKSTRAEENGNTGSRADSPFNVPPDGFADS